MKVSDDTSYWVMDGRANYDTDEALVLCTCETIEEAYDIAPEFGDAVIVDPSILVDGDFIIIDSTSWTEGLTPKRGIAVAKLLRGESST